MNSGYRLYSAVLCAALLTASTGCQTGQEAAQESTASLYPGMTMEEVSTLLGPPAQVIQGDPGADTFWIYRFQGGPNAVATVFMVILFLAMIAAVAMSKGGGSVGGGASGGEGPPSQVRIRFGGDGRLIEVSPPQPVPGP